MTLAFDINPQDPLALRLRALLARVSIRKLSRVTGIAYDRLGRVLRGDLTPRPGEIERIAQALDQTPQS